MQSDINGKSGFARMADVFNNKESSAKGIHCFDFYKEDIVRSEILKFIVEKIETANILQNKATTKTRSTRKT